MDKETLEERLKELTESLRKLTDQGLLIKGAILEIERLLKSADSNKDSE